MSKIYLGIVVDDAENSIERAQKLLAGIPGGVYKAVGSALSRAASSARSAAKKPVTDQYTLSQSEFSAQTKTINHFQRGGDGTLSIVFGFRGNVIALTRFLTGISADGRITTRVKRTGAQEALDNAFYAQMGGHTGVYERLGADRFPVRELYGPATPQMMYSNEDIMDAIEEKAASTYAARIDHEIDRVLLGYGR